MFDDLHTNLFGRASRFDEILVGAIILAAALLLGYFGVRGATLYLLGSRAAPADPIASAIGIIAGIGGGYLGLRLLVGWKTEAAVLPGIILLVGGLLTLLLAIASHIKVATGDATMREWRYSFGLTVIGLGALALWWRRLHGRL